MARYGMVIDLQKCTGCGGCSIACKGENNVPDGIFWSHYITKTEGKYPNVKFTYTPTLCNHCTKAACVAACPVDPKVMHKNSKGLTLHDADRCIGCRSCEKTCPYGVIFFNGGEVHSNWLDQLGKAVTQKVGGTVIPYYNPDRALTYPGIRSKGKVEKCTMCDHRVANGAQPRCVEACPAKARVFGDLDAPGSEASYLLKNNKSTRLKEEAGTQPNVYYVGTYTPQK